MAILIIHIYLDINVTILHWIGCVILFHMSLVQCTGGQNQGAPPTLNLLAHIRCGIVPNFSLVNAFRVMVGTLRG